MQRRGSKEKWVVSWSGGKDCTVALYRGLRQGLNISHLLTVVRRDGRSTQHRIPWSVLEAQASSLDLRLAGAKLQLPSYRSYQASAFQGLQRLKQEEKITGCIFGDINAEWRRSTNESMCEKLGIKAHHPLWGNNEEEIVEEFINQGFGAMIIAVNSRFMGEEWLGKSLNKETLNLLKKAGLNPSGEGGQFHTIVTGGPLFKNKFRLTKRVVNSSLLVKHLDLRYITME